jgi:hypothetical protein
MAHTDYSNEIENFVKEIEYCKSLKVGDKIKFESERKKYTVKAKSDRYLICTKPFNPKHTVLYTIIDLKRLVRGPDNSIFGIYDYGVQEDIDRCLMALEKDSRSDWGDFEVSHRRSIKLDIEIQ